MKRFNRFTKTAALCGLALNIGALSLGCAGGKMAAPLDVAALRSSPATAVVGYTTGVGVPTLAERVRERPGLKLAILQVAYKIEGRPAMTFVSDQWQFGGTSHWTETTTPEILVPTTLARESAAHLAQSLEEALAKQGFGIVSRESVAKTRAYAQYYGDYPIGYNLENGWTVVGAHPLKVKEASNLIDYSTMNWVWPDTKALPAIKAELGEDVLFLNLQVQVGTMPGTAAGFDVVASVDVNDPNFVGYGVGGFGHAVVNLNANTGTKTTVPGFLRRDGKMWTSNWTPIYEDLTRVHKAFASGFAAELQALAHPPAN